MARSDSLTVSIVPIESALATLRDEWGMTSPETIDDPTMSPDWLEIWWRHFGKPGTEQVLCLLAPDGRKVGFLFTRLETDRYYGLPVRTVRCWVNGHAQRANLILRCDADAAARALAEHWARNRQWDLLRLHGLPEGEFTESLPRHVEALRCRCTTTRTWGHSRIKVDQPWERYFRTGISRDTRKEIRRQGRRLADLGNVRWTDSDSTTTAMAGLEALMEIERQSWKREAGETIASDPALVAFYQDVVRCFSAAGMTVMTVLQLNDSPIAAALALSTRRRLVTLKTSFDKHFAKHSPGSQLYTHVTAQVFSGGFQELDFYGKMPFTERWAKDERRFCDLLIEAPTVRSWLIGLAWAAKNRRSAVRATRDPNDSIPGGDPFATTDQRSRLVALRQLSPSLGLGAAIWRGGPLVGPLVGPEEGTSLEARFGLLRRYAGRHVPVFPLAASAADRPAGTCHRMGISAPIDWLYHNLTLLSGSLYDRLIPAVSKGRKGGAQQSVVSGGQTDPWPETTH